MKIREVVVMENGVGEVDEVRGNKRWRREVSRNEAKCGKGIRIYEENVGRKSRGSWGGKEGEVRVKFSVINFNKIVLFFIKLRR